MSDDTTVKALVEIPKGSRNKYEVDPETGRVELDRRLYSSVSYPTEYGMVPGTDDGEGDALDALVCTTEATFPGCFVKARPVGVLRMSMGHGSGPANPKLVCVPLGDPASNRVEDAFELPEELRNEIAQFFAVYKDLEGEGSQVEVEGWYGRQEALDELARAQRRNAGES